MAAGPDEVRGSGPNQFVAHGAHETLRVYPIPGSTGSSSRLTTLAFPWVGLLRRAERNTATRPHRWRSEERRVGKEGRARWVGCAYKTGLLVRQLWPRVVMKCVDRVPISLSRTGRMRHCGFTQSPARPVRHHVLPPLHSPGLAC